MAGGFSRWATQVGVLVGYRSSAAMTVVRSHRLYIQCVGLIFSSAQPTYLHESIGGREDTAMANVMKIEPSGTCDGI